MAITLNGTTGITTPDLTSADDITANGSTVLTAATSPAALPLAGGTLTGNVNLGDNVKANFGAGSDLQIYHNSANNKSYIEESGTGNLVIRGSDIDILAGNGEAAINVAQDGAVTLYHDNAAKLATTTTGVTVTGNVDTSGTILVGNTNSVFAENNLKFNSGGASYIDHTTVGQAINFRVSNASSLDTTAMTISSSGVISGNGSGLTGVGAPTTFGAVGTYATLYYFGLGVVQGDTISGASLTTAGWQANTALTANGDGSINAARSSTTVSGTWRAMGWAANVDYLNRTRILLYVRIS
jgi:hypothetical protein